MCEDHSAVLREMRKLEKKMVEALHDHDLGEGQPCGPTRRAIMNMLSLMARDVRGRIVLNGDFFKSMHDLEDDEEYVKWRNDILMVEITGGGFGLN